MAQRVDMGPGPTLGGTTVGFWGLAQGSHGEGGGGGIAAMLHDGEALAGTGLTGSVLAPPVPGGSGRPTTGTWPG